MPGKVFVYMQAYNSEKTIRKSIDSVLRQTYPNFILLICNNGSADGTQEVIREYQEKDNRIRSLYIPVNSLFTFINKSMPLFLEQYADMCDYFCTLDPDDEYLPGFLERGVAFAEANDLDLCMGGTLHIDADTLKVRMERAPSQDLVIEGMAFDSLFPMYHQFTRTLWAKLYRTSLIRKMDYRKCSRAFYGFDTVFAQEATLKSRRMGIFHECLHKWYVSGSSSSHRYDGTRILADSVNFDMALDFLLLKTGRVTESNKIFLYKVYQNALRDTLSLILRSKRSVWEKVEDIHAMVSNHYSKSLFDLDPSEDLARQISTYLYSQNLFAKEEVLDKAGEILAILGQSQVAMRYSDPEKRFRLLLAMKKYWFERERTADIDKLILSLMTGDPNLKNLEIGCVLYSRDIVMELLCGKKADALGKTAALFASGEDIPDRYVMPLISLGLNLSAELEEQEQFIFFTKLQISALIQLGENQKAAETLGDWDELFPEDGDFQEFRRHLSGGI